MMGARALCLAVSALLLLAGCSGDNSGTSSTDPSQAPSASPTADAPPALGGEVPDPARPPTEPMDDLEQPIADELAGQVRSQGLTLDYLDCPDWDGEATAVMHCDGYLNGLVSVVRVRLTPQKAGALTFQATLESGIIATQNLVDTLVSEGYTDVDCGAVPAYPTKVDSRLVCSVTHAGHDEFVVATVTSKSGAVAITDY